MSSTEEPDCRNLNTTECLLRAATSILAEVKQNGQQYNWDPLSFAATLVIGVVALFFAALTIGQALIAAGPGRHKCSKYALGPWSQLSKRRFEWSEMRFQSTAYTPLINVAFLLQDFCPYKEGWDFPIDIREITGISYNRPKEKLNRNTKSLHEYFPATWLSLLTHTGLDHPGLWELKAAGTDYIPSDLAAAPAYSSIRDLVALCALAASTANIQLIMSEESNRLIAIRSPTFDLDLRQHPTLGMYAVFQTFASVGSGPRWDLESNGFSKNGISTLSHSVLLHSIGYVPLHIWVGNKYSQMWTISGLSTPTLAMKSTRHIQHFQLSDLYDRCRCSETSQQMTDNGSTTPAFDAGATWHSWCKSGGEVFSVDSLKPFMKDGSALNLLAGQAPPWTPLLFPRRREEIHSKMLGLLPFSRFWSLRRLEKPNMDSHEDEFLSGLEREKHNCSWTVPVAGTSKNTQCGNEATFTADVPALSMAVRSIGNLFQTFEPAHYLSVAVEDEFYNIRVEINEIDAWLEENVEASSVRCRWLTLSLASGVWNSIRRNSTDDGNTKAEQDSAEEGTNRKVLPPLKMFRPPQIGSIVHSMLARIFSFDSTYWPEGSSASLRHFFGKTKWESEDESDVQRMLHELKKFSKLWEMDSTTGAFVYPTNEVQHPLDDLLIYRALLVHSLFSVAVDNSDILEDHAYSKIIPIL